MNSKTCPVCGSADIEELKKTEIISVPYAGIKEVHLVENRCKVCESTGDFFHVNDNLLKSAIEELRCQGVINILDDFNSCKISFASIERALSIPQRTLTKWKNKSAIPTSTGIALLSYLRTFPWLIEVAENNFDYSMAQKIHLKDAFTQIINVMEFNSSNFYNASITTSSNIFAIRIEKDYKPQMSSQLQISNSQANDELPNYQLILQ